MKILATRLLASAVALTAGLIAASVPGAASAQPAPPGYDRPHGPPPPYFHHYHHRRHWHRPPPPPRVYVPRP